MTDLRLKLDHILCYTAAATVEDRLGEYQAAGFLPHPRTVRHDPGLRNGFVTLGPEYLEVLWVEDEAAFARSGPWRRAQRRARAPFALGISSGDVVGLRAALTAAGHAVPPVRHGTARDVAGPPLWSFLDLPPDLLPGVGCFALTYHHEPPGARAVVRVAENGVYALAGVTFVTAAPAERATRWRKVLGVEGGGDTAILGPHRLSWLSPEGFEVRYGCRAQNRIADLALVHLHSADLLRTARGLAAAGRQVIDSDGTLLVPPDRGDGFAFTIDERAPALWLASRREDTGEPLEIAA